MLSSDSPSQASADLSLDDYLHTRLPEKLSDVRRLVDPILAELAALHSQGRIHGGIQPAAVRFSAEGVFDREHFLSYQRSENRRICEEIPHAFRAPETFGDGASLDAKADTYAMGALLYKILTSSDPRPAHQRAQNDTPLLSARYSQWPGPLLELVNDCLALAKDARLANAQAIRNILGTEPPKSPVPMKPAEEQGKNNDLLDTGESPFEILDSSETKTANKASESGPAAPVSSAATNNVSQQDSIDSAPVAVQGTEEKQPDLNSAKPSQDAAASASSTSPVVETSPTVVPALAPEAAIENPEEPTPADSAAPSTQESTPPATVTQTGLQTAAIEAPSTQILTSIKSAIAPRLPNASVGKPYCRNVRELFGDQASRVAGIGITPSENFGLSFDEASETLHGTPTKAGEFNLELTFHLASVGAGRSELSHNIALTINPDPSSLWKNKPSDPAGQFAKRDDDKAALSTPQLTAIAASLRGRSHAHEGKYRDDDFALQLLETGWHLFIVADGAGSAKFSRRGSQIACETAAATLVQWLAPGNELDNALEKLGANAYGGENLEKLRQMASNPLIQAAYAAAAAIREQAEKKAATLRDFATTFIAVIGKKVGSHWFFASFAIGDGGAGVLTASGELKPLTKPDSGEFAGQTVFLTTTQIFHDKASLLARAQVDFFEDFRFLAVMTDGITDPIFQNDAAFQSADAWEDFVKRLPSEVNIEALAPGMEEALLQWLNFPSPGNHDDRTIILAVPKKADSPA